MSAEHYGAWIKAYVDRHNGSVLGRCHDAVKEMHAAFPELRVVRGHVYVLGIHAGGRAHWWLETPEGAVVDPTESQFPAVLSYEEWKPGDPVRIGKCMDCGQEIWEGVTSLDNVRIRRFCDANCEQSFASSLTGAPETRLCKEADKAVGDKS
jgi:hypothetical protein